MKSFLLLLFLAGCCPVFADEGEMENGALQFTGDPEKEKELVLPALSERPEATIADISDFLYDGTGTFQFRVSSNCDVLIQLVDEKSMPVATLFSGKLLAGKHQIRWKGSASGAKIQAGSYSVVFRQGISLEKDPAFGEAGSVQFKAPVNLMLAADGRLYVGESDKEAKEIIRLGADGKNAEVFKEFRSLLTLDDEGNVYCFNRRAVEVFSPEGSLVKSLGASPSIGFSCGPKDVYISREGLGHTFMLGTGQPCVFVKQGVSANLAPIHGKYVSPSLASDRTGNIYAADCFSTGAYKSSIAKYFFDGKKIEKSYHCLASFKDIIGIACAPGNLIYGVERGTITLSNLVPGAWEPDKKARLVQLHDTGSGLQKTASFELPEVQGARTLAVSSSGELVYVLEDSEDFSPGNENSLKGLGRLFKYKFKYAQSKSFPIIFK